MPDIERIRRLELLVALALLTAAVSALIVMLDALRFHAAALVRALSGLRFGDVHFEGLAMLAIAGLCLAAALMAIATATRQLLAQRALVRRLTRVGETIIDGRPVIVVRSPICAAFCAGWLRPRIFVSDTTLELLTSAQLRAVVAHEGHHVDRRDPLRLLCGRALTSSLRVIPAVGWLGRRQAVLAELAADAAAVRLLGEPSALASALLAFDEHAAGAVAPERVDQLLGERPQGPLAWLFAIIGVALTTVSSLALLIVVLPEHPTFPISSLPFCLAALAILASPAWLLTRRLGSAMQSPA